MDKKSKALLVIVILAVVISVGYTFYKTVIKGDFEVVNTEEELTDEDSAEALTDDSEAVDTSSTAIDDEAGTEAEAVGESI